MAATERLANDEPPLAHAHPVCHQRREAADRVCELCSKLSKGETQGFFCCRATCDFFMCRTCALSGSHSIITAKHRHGLVRVVHDELWHCDVCRRNQELPVAAAATATAASTGLPTAKPAVLSQMLASAKAVVVSDAAAVPATRAPAAYHCAAGCDFDVCEDCYANPQLEARKGGHPQRAAAEVRQGRRQIGGISVLCWVATSCRLLPAAARDPAAAAWQLLLMTAVLLLILSTLHRLTSYDASRQEPKARGEPRRRGDWFCERCQLWRARGTYHCGTCGECTDGFDHHCGVLGRDVGVHNQLGFIVLLLLGATGAAATTTILVADAYRLGEGSVGWFIFDWSVALYAGCQGVGYGVFAALQCQLAAAGLQQYRHEPCDACIVVEDDDPSSEPPREGNCATRVRSLVRADAIVGIGDPSARLPGVCPPCGGGSAVELV